MNVHVKEGRRILPVGGCSCMKKMKDIGRCMCKIKDEE
jgi:hypothetical protein